MMDEQLISELPEEFTEIFLKFCQSPAPEPVFIDKLEQRLRDRHGELLRSGHPAARVWYPFVASLNRRKWQFTAAFIFLMLLGILLAIGPQRVLAQVQRWFGYVPEVGFRDLANSRVLPSPIELNREGITLRVEKVIAGTQRTEVVISCQGFTEADLPGPINSDQETDFKAFLRLPDNSQLELTRWEVSICSGKLEFPPLPDDVYNISLFVSRLPLAPQGFLPENWIIPIALQPVDSALIDSLYPQPYSPPDACDTHYAITLCVLNVAQTASETAIQYQFTWTNLGWDHPLMRGMQELRDNLGIVYQQNWESNSSSVVVAGVVVTSTNQADTVTTAPSQTTTTAFYPLSLSASQATLWVSDLVFDIPMQANFNLDLGDDPQIGDLWPLDIHLDVAGFPVHITGANLKEKTIEIDPGDITHQVILAFDFDPFVEHDGFSLWGVYLGIPEMGIGGGSQGSFVGGHYQFEAQLDFPDEQSVPAGMIEVTVTGASLQLKGPWEATWDIPGKDPSNPAQLVRFAPSSDSIPGEGIHPVVEEVTMNDRFTGVRIGAAGLPPQAVFTRVLPYDPMNLSPFQSDIPLYLEDNLSKRYFLNHNQALVEPEGAHPGGASSWIFFEPIDPLAQSVSAHVPGMEYFIPGQAGFTVDVPQDLAFHAEEYIVLESGGGGPVRETSRSYQVSDSWAVDIAFDLAGYHLQFTKAQLEHNEMSESPYLLHLTGEPPAHPDENTHLYRLFFSSVERPDGRTVTLDPGWVDDGPITYPFGGVGPTGYDSDQIHVYIIMDVTADNRVDLLSGSYRVELSGVSIWLSGPWDISFSLPGN